MCIITSYSECWLQQMHLSLIAVSSHENVSFSTHLETFMKDVLTMLVATPQIVIMSKVLIINSRAFMLNVLHLSFVRKVTKMTNAVQPARISHTS